MALQPLIAFKSEVRASNQNAVILVSQVVDRTPLTRGVGITNDIAEAEQCSHHAA